MFCTGNPTYPFLFRVNFTCYYSTSEYPPHSGNWCIYNVVNNPKDLNGAKEKALFYYLMSWKLLDSAVAIAVSETVLQW